MKIKIIFILMLLCSSSNAQIFKLYDDYFFSPYSAVLKLLLNKDFLAKDAEINRKNKVRKIICRDSTDAIKYTVSIDKNGYSDTLFLHKDFPEIDYKIIADYDYSANNSVFNFLKRIYISENYYRLDDSLVKKKHNLTRDIVKFDYGKDSIFISGRYSFRNIFMCSSFGYFSFDSINNYYRLNLNVVEDGKEMPRDSMTYIYGIMFQLFMKDPSGVSYFYTDPGKNLIQFSDDYLFKDAFIEYNPGKVTYNTAYDTALIFHDDKRIKRSLRSFSLSDFFYNDNNLLKEAVFELLFRSTEVTSYKKFPMVEFYSDRYTYEYEFYNDN